jgi:hypothetical protein
MDADDAQLVKIYGEPRRVHQTLRVTPAMEAGVGSLTRRPPRHTLHRERRAAAAAEEEA